MHDSPRHFSEVKRVFIYKARCETPAQAVLEWLCTGLLDAKAASQLILEAMNVLLPFRRVFRVIEPKVSPSS